MNNIFIKICGITNLDDAITAANSGANAIGFVAFRKSARFINEEKVAEVCNKLPIEILKVGVFVNASTDLIKKYLQSGINIIQLHGDETQEYRYSLTEKVEVWKAVRLESVQSVEKYKSYPADKFLIDTFTDGKYGGSGIPCNRELAKFAVSCFGKPVILAGGLTPDNVAEIIKFVQPFGVDVSSGVESSAGKKDHSLVRKFIDAIRKTDS